jgi:hypothetical protein
MSSHSRTPGGAGKLVNDLTIEDARHILKCEGGPLTSAQLAFQVLSIVAVAAAVARAIAVGNATVWHLVLPMVAQYLVLLMALPVIYLAAPHPGLRKDVFGALRFWAGLLAAAGVAVAIQARMQDRPWRGQLASDASVAWRWIVDAQMHWPIVIAFASELAAIPGRVRNLYDFGPPFMGVSLGCAMRLVVPFFGCFLLPWAVGGSVRMAWWLWGLILAAEFLALWMHVDIQRRLRKIDGSAIEGPPKT